MDLPHQRANGVFTLSPAVPELGTLMGVALGPGSGDKRIVLGLYLVFDDDYP